MSMIRNIDIQELGLQSSALQTEEATQDTSLQLTAILCDQLAQLSNQATSAASTAVSATPTNPEEDPNFNINIPYKIVDGKKVVDFTALLQQLDHIMNFLRCNHMNFAALKEAASFMMNIGGIWDSLTTSQKALLKPILNQPISGQSLNIFGQDISVTSLGELAGYALVFEAFYSSGGDAAKTKQKLADLLAALSGHDAFLNECDFLKNVKKALDALNTNGLLDKWMAAHKNTSGQMIDDNGLVCTYQEWILDCQKYLGLLLNGSDLGRYDKNGAWEKIFYKTLINHFWEEFKNCHDPMILLAMLFSVLEEQNDDREDEIAGASQPGSYLAIVGQVNAKIVSLLTQGKFKQSFTPDEAKDFVGMLEEIKRYVNDDSDIGDDLKKSLNANLDTFLQLKVEVPGGRMTVEDLWKSGSSTAFAYIANGFTSQVFSSTASSSVWTQMTNALSGISDQCKEQSSISGTLVNSMTNTLNQCYATLKNLYDAFINLEQAYVRNELAK